MFFYPFLPTQCSQTGCHALLCLFFTALLHAKRVIYGYYQNFIRHILAIHLNRCSYFCNYINVFNLVTLCQIRKLLPITPYSMFPTNAIWSFLLSFLSPSYITVHVVVFTPPPSVSACLNSFPTLHKLLQGWWYGS